MFPAGGSELRLAEAESFRQALVEWLMVDTKSNTFNMEARLNAQNKERRII